MMWQGAAEVAAEALMLKQVRLPKMFAKGADDVAGCCCCCCFGRRGKCCLLRAPIVAGCC